MIGMCLYANCVSPGVVFIRHSCVLPASWRHTARWWFCAHHWKEQAQFYQGDLGELSAGSPWTEVTVL